MNSVDLSRTLDARGLNDGLSRRIARETLRALRDFLVDAIADQRGIVGAVVKIGLRKAIKLLDDYLARATERG